MYCLKKTDPEKQRIGSCQVVSLRRAAMLFDEQLPENGMHWLEVDLGPQTLEAFRHGAHYLAEVEQERVRIRFVLNFRLRFCKSASRGQPSWGGILPSRIGPRGSAWQRARTQGELETWSQRLGRWPAPPSPQPTPPSGWAHLPGPGVQASSFTFMVALGEGHRQEEAQAFVVPHARVRLLAATRWCARLF